MKIQNYGGATAVIEHRGKRFLFDPWMDEGIYHGSWHHFPPLEVRLEEIGKLDYVYISHIHEDHCSLKTLQKINLDAEIIIMDRKPNYVLNFLKQNQLNFKTIHLVPEKKRTQIAPGLVVEMLTADPNHELSYLIDSILILEWEGKVIFNPNDTPLYPEAIEYVGKNYPKIELALLPYSGGSGYPSCYFNLSGEQKAVEALRIRNQRTSGFYDAVEILKPKYAMPFADQYVIVGNRAAYNQYMAHPPSPGAIRENERYLPLKDKILFLNSGQKFDLDSGTYSPDVPFYEHTVEDRDLYIQNHSKGVLYDYEKVEFAKSVPFDRMVEFSHNRLWSELERRDYHLDFRFYLDTGEALVHELDFQRKEVKKVNRSDRKEPYLSLGGSRDLMIMMMLGHISWNIADAALFIDYERRPNQYNTIVQALINFLRI
jgi:UDP-MurNAc hydroxylase